MAEPVRVSDEQVKQNTKLLERDRFAKLAGVRILEARPGFARCGMKAGPDHLNSLDLVHGGAIFTLADVAFAAAANVGDRATVSINVSINYVKAGRPGGELIAECTEVSRQDKLGVYEVRVTDQQGEVIALFQGLAYRKPMSMADAIAKLPPRE